MDDESSQPPARMQGFDQGAEVQMSHRNLPHWFQPGAATFVTFRTADSMPQTALDLWNRLIRQYFQAQGINQNLPIGQAIAQLNALARRSFEKYKAASYHRLLDKGFGACALSDPKLSQIVADALLFFDGSRYDVDRFVVMPNHVHLLAAFRQDFDMRATLGSCMHYAATQINKELNATGAFWQTEPFDHCVRNDRQLTWVQHYIKDNPKKARLRSSCYHYWQRPEIV